MTRMWNLNPAYLCTQHLLGEHKEIHQAVGSILKGRSLKGHLEKGQLEIHNLKKRHAELVREMKKRNFNHNSPLPDFEEFYAGKIDPQKNKLDLMKRCKKCRVRIKDQDKKEKQT
ncbi:pyrimidine dimer DNA glycosylase/endonuclease V [Patescibacteria group bacterium]|nr:pyrimidine dimer DNA glycosylase/endonuclease V [Patescibacteria group bacterium]